MKNIVMILLSVLFGIVSVDAQNSINNSYSPNHYASTVQTESYMQAYGGRYYDMRVKKRDYALALVPGAVQMRRKWPAVAGTIWGGMVVAGGLAIYEQFHIVKLKNSMDGDSSNADWYHHKINQAKKVRNGSLIALGGIYVANYVTALLLPDRSPNRGSVALYADPQGAIGLTYALKF